MNEKDELTISIGESDSLKHMQKMPGWRIIEKFLGNSEIKYDKQLKNDNNDDIADIKACRKILKFIDDFKKLLKYTDIAAEEDRKELNLIK